MVCPRRVVFFLLITLVFRMAGAGFSMPIGFVYGAPSQAMGQVATSTKPCEEHGVLKVDVSAATGSAVCHIACDLVGAPALLRDFAFSPVVPAGDWLVQSKLLLTLEATPPDHPPPIV